ncbi:methyltransferase, TIGR04325 family [Rhizobium binae]|uniref:methyltransferase, TIGR04325 family n=1 Tax=Rhizobium binae TaxID=1138190 RepID=UPI001C830303|nr:methyltransferase, TIGR04325 family [Rhizobium binae]MBX4939819.1 methyltransferase, TIGR04325 family [Rhizobium binae]MBX4946338.1 methyltransferase, TIGR04325 family [Rhizobium binae]MBX4961169.1 methyltransferase, TIGR04325 family [Rhizobium binae]MBX4981803.1 methyltransferase, TIGR04325 family [Rhizobium binae]
MSGRFFSLLRRFLKPRVQAVPQAQTGYIGEFATWEEAKTGLPGYADPVIAQRVADGASEVLSGQKAYERDSITFEARQYAFPIATALLWASRARGGLNVLDFGGGLGTTYFQNKPFLQAISDVNWVIVEQQTFVEQGKRLFRDSQVSFCSDMREGLAKQSPDLAIFSSSLQYIERPYDVLEAVGASKVPMVVFDRTLFSARPHDVLTRQHVSAHIFSAVIPTWVFSESKFIRFMELRYRLVSKFPASCSTVENDRENRNLQESGYLFVLKGSQYDTALQSPIISETTQ